jgi:RinA family phage transcriptional activator
MKKTFQHIEQELYSYHSTKKEIEQLKNDIIHSTPKPFEGSRSNSVSSPVEAKVSRLLTSKRIEFLQDVVQAIDEVFSELPDDKKRLVEMKYWKRPQLLTWEGIAMECNISRVTAFRWRDEIITAIGDKLGWV